MRNQKNLKSHESNASLKVVVIGDSGIGKTNLITRYCQNSFNDSYVSTIGIDFKMKKFTYDNFTLRLQIWDTAGQQRFKNITNTFYKGAAGILIAFSITDETSFQNVSNWIRQINNNASNDVSKVLVGLKCDLQSNRKVLKNDAQNFAKRNGLKYIQASAKVGSNVQQTFRLLVNQIKQKYDLLDEPIFSSNGINIRNNANYSQSRRCLC